jgi:hypothetical protein
MEFILFVICFLGGLHAMGPWSKGQYSNVRLTPKGLRVVLLKTASKQPLLKTS